MAECDGGYYCRVCAEYVESVVDSEIYLRYVLKDIPLGDLARVQEAHTWCNGNLAQYIVDPRFDHPLRVDPDQDKSKQDSETRALMEKVITRAWQHLQTLPDSGLDVTEYPLDDLVCPHELEAEEASESVPR